MATSGFGDHFGDLEISHLATPNIAHGVGLVSVTERPLVDAMDVAQAGKRNLISRP